jgi:hypothetical protein
VALKNVCLVKASWAYFEQEGSKIHILIPKLPGDRNLL